MRPSIDFETYSEAGYRIDPLSGHVSGVADSGKGGLPVVGTPVYAEHPTAAIMCLCYDMHDGRGVRLWAPGMPNPDELLAWVANGGEVEAHNATFEWYAWNLVGTRRHGWPPLQLEQCHCSMAKSRRYGYPGGLDAAAAVAGTPGKDPAGATLLRKLSRPQSATKTRRATRWTPATAWPDFLRLYDYCAQDIIAEDALSAVVPELTPFEREVWLADQRINARGVRVDVESVDSILYVLGEVERLYTAELVELTGGEVSTASELERLRAWLARPKGPASARGRQYAPEPGHVIYDVQAETVQAALDDASLPPQARRALEIRQALSSANVKKFRKIKLQVSRDGRLRNQYMYCGAATTSRWSSAAADDSASNSQLQNMTAKGPAAFECEACGRVFGAPLKHCPHCGPMWVGIKREWDIKAVEQALQDTATRDVQFLEQKWGDVVRLLCGCLRGIFTARPGYELVCCDFSAIEAVVAACLARCQWRIDVFSTHGKIYEMSASKITGTPLEVYERYKKEHGTHHPDRKKIGKVAELASGYGGWITAWRNFGAEGTDEEVKEAILRWRAESPEIVEMWGGQYRWVGPGRWDYEPHLFGLEGMAISAILWPGRWFSHNDIAYYFDGRILYCRLPSGRYIHYHRARLTLTEDRLGRGQAYKIIYEGWNTNQKKGARGWITMELYGGLMFENVVQATARDIQAEAMLRCEAAGYHVVMHTHDELAAEVPIGFGSVEQMAEIMSQRPTWAAWWPIRAAGWRHFRYQKD